MSRSTIAQDITLTEGGGAVVFLTTRVTAGGSTTIHHHPCLRSVSGSTEIAEEAHRQHLLNCRAPGRRDVTP